jgi:hypothetical protein
VRVIRRGLLYNCFESGFTGFRGLERTSSFLKKRLFVVDYFLSSLSPLRYAAARGFEMKAPFNNNLPPQTNDVMVNPQNPVNPDSNNWLQRA